MLRIVAVMVRSKARQNKIGVDPRSDKEKGDQRNFGMVFFVLKHVKPKNSLVSKTLEINGDENHQ